MRCSLLVLSIAVLACGGDAPSKAAPAAEPATPATPPAAPAAPSAEPTTVAAPAAPANTALGKILPTAPIPIDTMLGSKAADAESQLGEPQSKGMMRKTCVRHLPDRTWFSCDYAEQVYADPASRFEKIGLQFTDGVVTGISVEGLKGEGPFDPKGALTQAGLELPGEPSVHTPAEGVTVYSYFNSAARLRIHDKEFRVEVSTVDNEWARSKVELLENSQLTPEQAGKIVEVKPKNAG